ncbi:sodium:solute symporter family transporter [Candidatus Laterigemmans baculatus]|uniref:sodium:solute symporter family transporter n=1 Tax=Candidatus Laterigemmans baculatus TaxID=2770505 RepID=UPI0013DA8D28|nr:transporter [Candidatus Laterigemmans baculatus]
MSLNLNISSVDAAIVLLYVAATLAMGVWIGRSSNTLSGFLVGGRSLPWLAVLGSIIATETSAVTFLSVPGITFAEDGNFGFLQLALGFILGRFIVIGWLLPSYFKGEIFTAYDVLHQRFGGLTQRTASLIFLITRTVADGLRLYLTGLVLEKVTGIDTSICIAAIGAATIVYATLGGIKSVVWNDCIQLIVYLAGAVAAIWVIASGLPGGLQEIVDSGRASEKFQWIRGSFSLASANLWAGVIGGSFISLASHGTDQMMVQRLLCARNRRGAALALGGSGPLVFLQFALFLFVGVALAAHYQHLGTEVTLEKDEVFARFIVDVMPMGLCGLTLAAVFSVAMSTLSSSLSSSASAVVNDFLKPRYERQRPSSHLVDRDSVEGNTWLDRRLTRASRLWTAIFGGCQILVGVIVVNSPSLASKSVVNQVITVAALTSGLVLGVFILGHARRRFAERSILIAMLSGFFVTVLCIMPPPEAAWAVHGWWAAVIASGTTFVVAWAVDLAFPAPAPSPEP